MPKDHFQKPPTNEEKINMLLKNINQLYQIAGDINTRLITLSRAKLPAADFAKFMRDSVANEVWIKNLNLALEYEAAQETKKQNEKLKEFMPKDNDLPAGNATV